ncbi:LANO_0G13960g1_1 [Lachancea nothofagi CBS 11611]|uniref:LANO_0G13960g1_1 n=1 Tax=Lachancea nothofagi CBS 11611 TaxID=1266666 RepID=A0A1G4KK44_9SACH|nr:LANO_0G13960g1_1 [Lachancea nothofagi CBS 11611]
MLILDECSSFLRQASQNLPRTAMLAQILRKSPNASVKQTFLVSVRKFHFTSHLFDYKKWADLSTKDKQTFINGYVDMYKEKHPCSHSNTMHRMLVGEMEEYGDTPYVFGILYNEIRSISQNESVDNVRGKDALGDPDFEKLLSK